METIERKLKLGNGNIITYKEYNGTCYDKEIYLVKENKTVDRNTDNALIEVLDRYLHNRRRVRVWYGNRITGRSWNEEYNVMGYIGRSSGDYKEPLLVHNSGSYGGPALLSGSIVRIDDIKERKTLWKHPDFHVGKMTVEENKDKESTYKYLVFCENDDGQKVHVASFPLESAAVKWIAFMNGGRYSK